MSEESKALARRYLEVFAEGNFDVLAEILAPDHAEHDHASEGELRGHDGVRRDLEPYVNAFSETQVATRSPRATGWRRASPSPPRTSRSSGASRPRGAARSQARCSTRVTGGKLAEGWWNWGTLGPLQQLGAIPAEQPA